MAYRFRASRLLALLLGLLLGIPAGAADTADRRAWQHGIDLVRIGGKLLLVWGSAGHPPRPNLGGAWPHDVYYAWLGKEGAAIEPRLLVARPEAQEPPSTAVNDRGTLLMTTEDGNGGISQRAGMWVLRDDALKALRKYPFTIRRGGHSGHAAAMGSRFLVVYGEGWESGGGWLELGTGADLHARIVGKDGARGREIALATGQRDSWPLVAGSDRNWLVIWQRYPGLTLESALIDASGRIARRTRLAEGLALRYTYSVDYSPDLSAYVVAGTSAGRGFMTLIGLNGEILRTRTDLPPMASESRTVLGRLGSQLVGVYPAAPSGLAVVRLSPGSIEQAKVIEHPHEWDYSGTTGAFVGPGRILMATLSTGGLRLIPFDLQP